MKEEKQSKAVSWLNKNRLKIAIFIFILILMFIFKVKIITTTILILGAGYIQYLFAKYQLRIDLGHIFFIGLILARAADPVTAVIFVIIAGIVPKGVGGDIDPVIVIAYIVQAIAIFISGFIAADIVISGVIFAILTFGLIFIITVVIEDFNVIEVIDDTLIPLGINLFLFFSISRILLGMLNLLY